MFKKVFLFGLLTIIISVIVVSAYEDKFPRMAYDPIYDPNTGSFNRCFPQAESLGFTGLIGPGFNYPADWDAGRTHHLNLVSSWIERFSWGQYSVYQADGYNEWDWFEPRADGERIRFLSTKYNNAGHGRQIQDTTVHDTTIYAWFVSKDNPNDNRGYVLYDLWNERAGPGSIGSYAIDYSREQDKDGGLTYNVIFKLKYPKNPTYLPTDTVAKLEVHIWKDTTHTHMVLAESLLLYDTTLAGQYHIFRLTFVRPPYHSSDSVDYKVYWYKQTDLYVDYVEVYDRHYDLLFNVKSCPTCNTTVYEDSLLNDWYVNSVESNYKGTSLYRWYLRDQPAYDQFRSSREVNRILNSVSHAPGIQAAGDFDYINSYRYLNELEPYPQEFFYDDYPILRDKTPQYNNDAWQQTMDSYAGRLSKVADATKSKGKEWWYIAQTFNSRYYPDVNRYPHNNELRAIVYMALAYGAKGVGYYRYTSSRKTDPPDTLLHEGGIVDTLGGHIRTYPYPDNQYYAGTHEYLFDAVKDINQKLDTLGPILKKLDWKWAGPSDSARYAPGSFVLSVDGVACTYCGQDCKWPPYQNHVQVGMFKDNSLVEDYLMLVNRRVGDYEKPCEEITLHDKYPRYYYLIDCLKNSLIDTVVGSYDAFHIILNPGEGRLFRFANFLPPTNLYGSVVGSPQKICIRWTDPDINQTGFKIDRKSASQPQWSPLASIDSNVTSYYDNNNLLGSETYYYKVKAFDQWYNSEYSNEATVKNIPNPPRNLTARLNRICCPGRGAGAGSGVGINAICPYCYTNEIILSWQAPQNQKSGTLASYRVRAWRTDTTWTQYQTVPYTFTSMTFCVPAIGKSYNFQVYAIDSAGNISNPSTSVNITSGTTDNCGGGDPPAAKIIASVVPEKFELFQNYPNPFNFGTLIKYALPEESEVKIVVYNLLGQKVKVLVEENQAPGYYTIYWDGKGEEGNILPSGIYFYKISTSKNSEAKKLILMK